MNKVYIRKRWIPLGLTIALFVIYIAFLAQTAVDHLDRLNPDWTGLSRTLPFFAYVAVLIIVFGTSATHIQVSSDKVRRYHSPLPIQRGFAVPFDEIEQVLFWRTGARLMTRYGLGLQTRSGRRVLCKMFRSRDEVLVEVKRIADALGERGLSTVKVAETRAATSKVQGANPWIIAGALFLLFAFYRLARF